eukprot:GHVT01078031.1.p2 GENE.GHVT01078031.1~~GHVT01078031.1.p2  ORF type:complete len:100 (+),score=12.75 GHVT01078031.1:83-382(+)
MRAASSSIDGGVPSTHPAFAASSALNAAYAHTAAGMSSLADPVTPAFASPVSTTPFGKPKRPPNAYTLWRHNIRNKVPTPIGITTFAPSQNAVSLTRLS